MKNAACLIAFVVASFASASAINAQSIPLTNDAAYNYEVHIAPRWNATETGWFVVLYRGSGHPEYVGPFDSQSDASSHLFQSFEFGFYDGVVFSEIEYTTRLNPDWQLADTFDTYEEAKALTDSIRQSSARLFMTKIRRVSATTATRFYP